MAFAASRTGAHKNTDVASFEFHIIPITEQPDSFGDNATLYACNAMKAL